MVSSTHVCQVVPQIPALWQHLRCSTLAVTAGRRSLMVRLTVRGTRSPVILLERLRFYEDRLEPKLAVITAFSSRPQASPCVRYLQNCLTLPSQASRAGKRGAQTREGRGEGSRPAGTRRAEQRMLARHRKPEPGEHGPAASMQAGSSVGRNMDMNKAPGRRAPRNIPPEQGPHTERSGARVAGHD